MGEFSFRSASAMNINLKASVGSVQQTTSKLQAAAAAAAANQNPSLPATRSRQSKESRPAGQNKESRAAGQSNPKAASKPGKYRTTVSLSDSGPGTSAIRVVPARYKSPTFNVLADNRLYSDMKGVPSPMDDTYDSFDPPPPLKQTVNGHSEVTSAVVEDKSGINHDQTQQITSVLTNGVDAHLNNGESQSEHQHFHVREFTLENPEPGEAGATGGPDDHPFFSVARDVKQPETYKNELQIVSAKGTVRGFKNRVRAGIAVFRQQNDGVKVGLLIRKFYLS